MAGPTPRPISTGRYIYLDADVAGGLKCHMYAVGEGCGLCVVGGGGRGWAAAGYVL